MYHIHLLSTETHHDTKPTEQPINAQLKQNPILLLAIRNNLQSSQREISHSLHSRNSQEHTNPSITEPLFVHTQRIFHGWREKEPYL
jgi:hypothetical protein